MAESVVVDFRGVGKYPFSEEFTKPHDMSRQEVAIEDSPVPYDRPPDDQAEIEAIKATYLQTGGNLAETARQHEITPRRIKRMAIEQSWSVYGEPKESHEKASKTKLRKLADTLETQMFQLMSSLEVEVKDEMDSIKDGRMSSYVATLSQRNSAFQTVFDRYMRVMAILEPETFGEDTGGSNGVARNVRSENHPDALGGVDGINRELAAFVSGFVYGHQDQVRRPAAIAEAEVIDVNAVDR